MRHIQTRKTGAGRTSKQGENRPDKRKETASFRNSEWQSLSLVQQLQILDKSNERACRQRERIWNGMTDKERERYNGEGRRN